MMNGQIFQGELFIEKNSTYVLDTDGTRQDIDLQQVSRVVQPGIPLPALDQSVTLKYPDEVVLHGKVTQVNSERMILRTAFADEPVTCSLAGASRLHFTTNRKTNETIQNTDMLFHATGNLRGRVLFTENRGISFIQWEAIGALKTREVSKQPSSSHQTVFRTDIESIPTLQHYPVPSRLTSADRRDLSRAVSPLMIESPSVFQSPFISAQHLDSAHIKALEFSERTYAPALIERSL